MIIVISNIKHLTSIVDVYNANITDYNNNVKTIINECIGYKYVNNKLDKYITLTDTTRNDVKDINDKLNTIYKEIKPISDTQIFDMSKHYLRKNNGCNGFKMTIIAVI